MEKNKSVEVIVLNLSNTNSLTQRFLIDNVVDIIVGNFGTFEILTTEGVWYFPINYSIINRKF